ncbi:protein of unknown function [Bryocella elongata]|uniref:Peptidase n=2 Tax=Bryocella elongata TaxID=863522 RepID=A0A1H6A7D3_9BACT|nr:protein of unknown function [Bryocella elongata]
MLCPLLALACVVAQPIFAQRPGGGGGSSEDSSKPLATIAARTANMQHKPGMIALDYDARAGKVYMEVPMTGNSAHTESPEYIYATTLVHGTGSNDLGMDRGQLGGVGEGPSSSLVKFVRSGPKVLLMQPNIRFRSSSDDPNVVKGVTDSFAESVMAGFTVQAEGPDGTLLLDATDFFVRDARGAAQVLNQMKQGQYRFDPARSALVPDEIKSFPKNIAVESVITVASEGGMTGRYVRDVTPNPSAMTVHERQMLIELPPPGFTPRKFSPRSGFSDHSYRDYTVPQGDDMEQQLIARFRLIKKDPNCKTSCEAVQPIQYYVDNAAQEPLRSALLEGARWWDQAFQAAGWAPGTFKVDVLPNGADPMDIRYNMIQWVHRYTRGWSYGASITDPRTGEIIKGNVTLGSLRSRQDYMIAEAMLSPYKDGKALDPANDPMLKLVLQRIRQLAAHETGHTIGLAHNYAASTFPHAEDVTTSVMEYPHPWITVDKAGKIDTSHAYPVNIGIWDKTAIDYGYREFDKGGKPVEDPAALEAILEKSEKTGMVFLTDQDARPLGSPSPIAHLWDNGTEPSEELLRTLQVREVAMKNFGINAIKNGEPLADLEDKLVVLYLFHRYQLEATIKEIGGLDYRANTRGDGQMMPTVVSDARQQAAIDAALKTLSPEVLTIPESLLAILPPRPVGTQKTRESFAAETGMTFDPIAVAESAADLTLQELFNPERDSRIVQYHMRNPPSKTSLRVLMEAVSKETARRIDGGHTMSSEVERAVEFRGLETMLGLAVDPAASSQVRAIALYHIEDLLKQWTTEPMPTDSAEAIHRKAMIARIEDFKRSPDKFVPVKPIEAPPGMPIGDEDEFDIY